jgi:hypothetical protein
MSLLEADMKIGVKGGFPKMEKGNNGWQLLVLWGVIFLISSGTAHGDGGYVWKETFLGQAKSGGQQAVVLFFDARETLVLQTEYDGELADFSWLIPTPSPITADDVHEADANVYYWLDDLTAPSFYSVSVSSNTTIWGGCSCSGGGTGGGASFNSETSDQDHVEVLETILTETYEVNLLSALDAQDLIDWLAEHDYGYPAGAEAVFGDYILQGWYFLAVRIRPSNPGEITRQSIAPIQISVETDEPVYPMRISSLSSEPETEILIHIISDHRYQTANVSSQEVDFYDANDPDNYKTEYKRWMKAQVEESGGELYFVEYAGWLADDDCLEINDYLTGEPVNCDHAVYVTRFRSYFSPDLFSDDVYFEAEAHDHPFRVRVEIWAESRHPSFLYAGTLFFLCMTFVAPKRWCSETARQSTRLGLLMILCVLLF